jgi:two-component system, OmpR family, KDP operon response regulator KdpE
MKTPPHPTTGARILVCDDEPQILRALRVILGDAGFEVATTASGAEALDSAAVRPPDAAIVDLLLPDLDGVEVLHRFGPGVTCRSSSCRASPMRPRKSVPSTPAPTTTSPSPSGPDELVARINAVLRRAARDASEPRIVIEELDLAAHRVAVSGEPVHVTPTEFSLLRALVRNRGRLMTHSALLREVWGPAYEGDTPLLRAHIANLRQKIEPEPSNPRYLRTDPGIGYRLAG